MFQTTNQYTISGHCWLKTVSRTSDMAWVDSMAIFPAGNLCSKFSSHVSLPEDTLW